MIDLSKVTLPIIKAGADNHVTCPECDGSGKVECDNPDHGFIFGPPGSIGPGDIGRIGCPGCGHSGQRPCDECGGTGVLKLKRCSGCKELKLPEQFYGQAHKQSRCIECYKKIYGRAYRRWLRRGKPDEDY